MVLKIYILLIFSHLFQKSKKSYWMGLLSCAGVDPTNLSTSIVNLALQFQETHYSVKSKLRFAFVGGWHPWLFDEKMLLEIAGSYCIGTKPWNFISWVELINFAKTSIVNLSNI